MLYHLPHDEIVLGNDWKVALTQIEAESVETPGEDTGPVDVNEVGVPEIVGQPRIADAIDECWR